MACTVDGSNVEGDALLVWRANLCDSEEEVVNVDPRLATVTFSSRDSNEVLLLAAWP